MKTSIQFLSALILSTLIALFLFAISVRAQTPTPTKLSGQIVNATKDASASSVANLPVVLLLATTDQTRPISMTTQSDTDGNFSFNIESKISGTQFLVSTRYQGLDYFSDAAPFSSDHLKLPIKLTVYDSTNDDSLVRVSQTHFVFDVHTRRFDVVQIIIVQNAGDRAFVGAKRARERFTLQLPILAGASNVQFENPDADATTLRGDSVMTYTLPIFPGTDQIVYKYSLAFTPPTFQFKTRLPYDSGKVRVFLSDVGATITSAQLSKPASFQTQGGPKFILSTTDNIAAGTEIVATFGNLPVTIVEQQPTSTQSSANLLEQPQFVASAVIGISALGALSLLVYALRRRQQVDESETLRLELLKELAELDDDFAARKIPEAEYKELRAEVKSELLELTQGTDGSPAALGESRAARLPSNPSSQGEV